MSDSDKPEENAPQPPTPEEVADQGGRGEEQDPNGPVNTDYQDTDIHLNTVKKFVAGSFAVTVAFFVLMLIVHRFYKTDFADERGVATAEDRQIPGKDDALLQTDELVDLEEYNEQEEERLTMKTNAVEHAVIPVESAKQLMVKEGFPHSQVAMDGEEAVAEAPMETEMKQPDAKTAAVEKAEPESSAMASTTSSKMVPAEPELDMAMVSAGKQIWEQQCMAACHTGKRGAIAPNIEKAYGTMRKLEGGGEILMDTESVINSMNNPNEHIAKGYMPVMMKFTNILTETQKAQVAAYLRSQGKEIMVPAPVSEPEVAAEPESTPEPEPTMEAAPAPAAPLPAPAAPKPTPAPTKPAAPAPAPEAPVKPQAPAGTIFV